MTTDTKCITELREAADEAQAARLEAVAEIARLTKSLRAAETERNITTSELVESRLAFVNAEACRVEASRQMNTAHAERDKIRAELAYTCDVLAAEVATRQELGTMFDSACADAERLANACELAKFAIGDDENAQDMLMTVAEGKAYAACHDALAVHVAATGKAMTGLRPKGMLRR